MSELWTPGLADFVATAAVVLEVPEETIERLPGLPMAESALMAPLAGVGEEDAYPDLVEKASVLIERLARNHPLPDGNKRTSLALMILFLERNGLRWGAPEHDRDVGMVEQVASGDADRLTVRNWIEERTQTE